MREPEKSIHEQTREEDLVNEAERIGAGGSRLVARQMEMTRRNNVALRAFSTSSDRWSRRLFWLTLVLAIFTVVLIALTWALLDRGG